MKPPKHRPSHSISDFIYLLPCYGSGPSLASALLTLLLVLSIDVSATSRNIDPLSPTNLCEKTLSTEKPNRRAKTVLGLADRTPPRTLAIEKYKFLVFTSPEENKEWARLKKSPTSQNLLFQKYEASQLKFLNDTLKDEDFVTALVNRYFQALLDQVPELKRQFPNHRFHLYSDYKDLRFAIEGAQDPQLIEALEQLGKNADQIFYSDPIVRQSLRAEDLNRGLFRRGFGLSAVQANSAARFSRRLINLKNQGFDEAEVQAYFKEIFEEARNLHDELVFEFLESSMTVQVQIGESLILTLDRAVLNYARKLDQPSELAQVITKHFRVPITIEQAARLKSFAELADKFSPEITLPKRVHLELDSAPFGLIATDIAGAGSQNLQKTAWAIALKDRAEEALETADRLSDIVTDRLNQQRDTIQERVKVSSANENLLFNTGCSGDDCIGKPMTRAYTDQDKREIIRTFARDKNPSEYRNVFVGPEVQTATDRSILIGHGNSLEKLLRKKLQLKVDPKRLEQVTFGLDMRMSQPGQGGIQLILGQNPSFSLSSLERKEVIRAFEEALKEINLELNRKNQAGSYQVMKVLFY